MSARDELREYADRYGYTEHVNGLLNAYRAEVLAEAAAELEAASPWQRAVDGLNALVDADVIFHVEPDGHISAPFGDEHIEWDLKARRWVLTHDDEDEDEDEGMAPHPASCRVPASPDCTCPPVRTR